MEELGGRFGVGRQQGDERGNERQQRVFWPTTGACGTGIPVDLHLVPTGFPLDFSLVSQ